MQIKNLHVLYTRQAAFGAELPMHGYDTTDFGKKRTEHQIIVGNFAIIRV